MTSSLEAKTNRSLSKEDGYLSCQICYSGKSKTMLHKCDMCDKQVCLYHLVLCNECYEKQVCDVCFEDNGEWREHESPGCLQSKLCPKCAKKHSMFTCDHCGDNNQCLLQKEECEHCGRMFCQECSMWQGVMNVTSNRCIYCST